MYEESSNPSPNRWRKFWPVFPLIFIAIALLLGWAVMFLWNWILPEALGANPLTYPKALGLLVLCRILFGGFRGGGPRKFGQPTGKHWMNMSDDERAKMKAEWADRCRRKSSSEL